MIRRAIIILLVNYCAFLFSQAPHFSRNFEARKKNIPLEILNNHPSYFYVLRLNNVVHDITIERRAKPSAEIIAFTPLKLDSVNAGWFDYENLDHLFFEQDHKAYFLFEKTLNTKKTIYLKIIDTTGKASGFIELASLEKDNATYDFEFTFKRTSNNNILIIASRYGLNGLTRTAVILFDTRAKKTLWTKKLPLEISETESSEAFECNIQNDLFYIQTKSVITGYESYYRDNLSYTVPLLKLDSVSLIKWECGSDFPAKENINPEGMTSLKEVFIFPKKENVIVSLQGLKEFNDGDSTEVQIINIKINNADLSSVFSRTNYYNTSIKDQLTFYDNPRTEFYYKEHHFLKNHETGSYLYTISQRTEGYYHKELLLRKTDLKNGEVVAQKIIPRKIFFFKNRTRFKGIGNVMIVPFKDSLKIIVLENPANFKKDPDRYDYKGFKKETRLWNSHIISYSPDAAGRLEKKLVFKNGDFDLVPLRYESNGQKDIVFYLNSNKYEKFAILQLYP